MTEETTVGKYDEENNDTRKKRIANIVMVELPDDNDMH